MKLFTRWFLLPIWLVLIFANTSAIAQEGEASLDNMWDDAAAKNSAPVPSANQPASAPLCGLQALEESHLVEKGGWPGIGPFKVSGKDPYDLVDEKNNHLKLSVVDKAVTQVELSITKDKPSHEDFLDLQMGGAFLMEAVGARAKRVREFADELEKMKDSFLLQTTTKPLSLQTGHYLVLIERLSTDNPERFQYVFRVKSRDASPDAIKEHSLTQDTKNVLEDHHEGAIKKTAQVNVKPANTAVGTNDPALRQEFLEVVKNWQKVKKLVTRQRQVSDLSSVLSGRALTVQTDSVKKLLASHRYWEINPKGVAIDRYNEQVPGRKYQVLAQVKQSKKFIDETSGQVLKEDEDSDKVNYILEKIGNRWYITDYAIVGSSPQTTKSEPGKVSR